MRVVGKYRIYDEFAAGGMASIHFGKLGGEGGFSRLVAIKRMHPQFTKDAEFVKMFMDEARVAGRVQHPNVVGVLDVVRADGELLLVMDYVHGESLARLMRALSQGEGKVPAAIAARLAVDLLQGLHAAHEATGEHGAALGIVHRDVSPQNLLVGLDGIARVVDFGIAKAEGRLQDTTDGSMKGKIGYFSPEQLGHKVDRRTDVFAASIVLWEMLSGKRLFTGDTPWEVAHAVVHHDIVDPSLGDPRISTAFGAVIMRGLSRELDTRFQTAREMAVAIEACTPLASHSAVADWVCELAGESLNQRREQIARSEELESDLVPPASVARRREVGRQDLPPPSAIRRGRISTLLVVLATAGVTLGIGGIVLAYAVLVRERTPTAPSVAPTPGDASSSSQPSEQPVESTPAPSSETPSSSASSTATTSVISSGQKAGPRAPTPEEQRCKEHYPAGLFCNGECIRSTSWRRDHCGKCNHSCGPLEVCRDAKCVTPVCMSPWWQLCPNHGCTFIRNDTRNCGACGKLCTGRCQDGVCISGR